MSLYVNQKLEFHVEKAEDGKYYIRGYNLTGGRELTTWFGYEDKEHTVREFQSLFPIEIYDPENHCTWPVKSHDR